MLFVARSAPLVGFINKPGCLDGCGV